MRITFLGHQGWRFECNGRSFLLDPILEELGNGTNRLPVWPPRRLDFAAFEPLDAVIVSHEHADHFSLDTLMALPRRCCIYVSDLSSSAMSAAIARLGFRVERFCALQSFKLCGIRVTPLPGLYNTLEPDAYALLMQDDSGASFLTAIDTVAHPDISTWLAAQCPRRTLDSLTNNFVEPRQALLEDRTAHTRSRATVAANALDFVQKFAPRRAVITGQGWSFKGIHEHLNHSCFSVDNRWLAAALGALAPHVDWFEGVPGIRFTLHGQHCSIDRAPEIDVAAAVSRQFDAESVHRPEPFAPWSTIRQLPADRLRKVSDFITQQFGCVLGAHAPRLMERLYYLKMQGVDELCATLAISVRNGPARHLFELDYGHLTFRETVNLKALCAVGLEIWAADLELLIGAEEEAFLIYESAVRTWSCVPAIVEPAMLIEVFMWFTPRFRPAETYAFYRARIAELTSARQQSPQAAGGGNADPHV